MSSNSLAAGERIRILGMHGTHPLILLSPTGRGILNNNHGQWPLAPKNYVDAHQSSCTGNHSEPLWNRVRPRCHSVGHYSTTPSRLCHSHPQYQWHSNLNFPQTRGLILPTSHPPVGKMARRWTTGYSRNQSRVPCCIAVNAEARTVLAQNCENSPRQHGQSGLSGTLRHNTSQISAGSSLLIHITPKKLVVRVMVRAVQGGLYSYPFCEVMRKVTVGS